MMLIPKNWKKFQHYKTRSAPWVKLHKSILDDRDFVCLPLASKALAPLLWLLASESLDGSFHGSVEELAFRLRWSEKDITAGLNPLIDKGFFINASTMLATCLHVGTESLSEGETEGEGEEIAEKASKKKNKTSIPKNFSVSESVKAWAIEKGHDQLDTHLENFIDSCQSKNYQYIDWDAAFRKAIAGNWAKVATASSSEKSPAEGETRFLASGEGQVFYKAMGWTFSGDRLAA